MIGLFLIPLQGQAQLLEVKQTVFGMDCAPCAYGLEKRIQRIEGVESASVSLNNGLLTASLEESNHLTLNRIRMAVQESGFQAKEAVITISGSSTKSESGDYVLETGNGERFLLKIENRQLLDRLTKSSTNIVITGKVDNINEPKTILMVQDIHHD